MNWTKPLNDEQKQKILDYQDTMKNLQSNIDAAWNEFQEYRAKLEAQQREYVDAIIDIACPFAIGQILYKDIAQEVFGKARAVREYWRVESIGRVMQCTTNFTVAFTLRVRRVKLIKTDSQGFNEWENLKTTATWTSWNAKDYEVL